MAQQLGRAGEGSAGRLVALAVQLREAAAEAGRLDVAAKADEAVTLLADSDTPSPDVDQAQGRRDTGNALLRTLDGLGF